MTSPPNLRVFGIDRRNMIRNSKAAQQTRWVAFRLLDLTLAGTVMGAIVLVSGMNQGITL